MDHYHLATRGDNDGLWDWNLTTNRVHFAPRWVAMVGYAEHQVGQSPDEWLGRVHPEEREEVRREIDQRLADGSGEFSLRHRMLHKDGTYRWTTCHAAIVRDQSGRAVRMMGFHADVSAETLADPLTGLPNRLLLIDRLERAVEHARHSPDWLYAALVVDLDRPPAAREERGTDGSDPLLAAAARRLETCLRTGSAPASLGGEYVVTRLDGDQFGILLEGLRRMGDAGVSAERVLAGMMAPFSAGGREVFVQASVGIAVSATGYHRAEDVLRDADMAVHRARALGMGRCVVFDTAALDSARAQAEMDAELERAIERREFVLFYQPIVSLATNRVAGLEALVRWRHPKRGLVPPMEFIPPAEKTGAIVRIGAWVVREACRQLAAWRATIPSARDIWVSVNLSSVQFRDPTLFEQIGGAIRDARLPPGCLMVELTESTVMDNPAAAKGLVMKLRVLGVRVGIDDFGTGHSALASLHQFPADFLKVDRSFVRGLDSQQDMAEIVKTVNGLAERLGLEVIAEGIERAEQLAVIRSLRCGYVQGFLLARPADSEKTAAILEDGLAVVGEREPVPAAPRSDAAHDLELALPTPSTWGWRPLGVAAAAAVLLISVGLVVRVATGTRLPASPPAAAAAHSAAPPVRPAAVDGALVAPAAGTTPAGSSTTTPSTVTTTDAPPSSAAVPRAPAVVKSPTGRPTAAASGANAEAAALPPAGPAAESFQVVHRHALGSCTGHLIVTPAGISFVPETSADGFTLDHHAFLLSLSDDALVVKSEKRTYRFKAPGADAGAADSRELAQKVLESVARQSRAR
jgi:diguanylate cyclase (GGDEF)-like protein/PAS domain S-box-containing protein